MYDFKFGGAWLSEYKGIVTAQPSLEIAQQDFTLVDMPGKSGSEYISQNRYKNVEFSRSIGFAQRPGQDISHLPIHLINWLAYKQGYQTFEDTHHPNLVTQAVLTNFAEIVPLLSRIKTATLQFSRKPFWYLKSGLEKIKITDFANGITLNNPFALEAKPLIEIVFADNTTSSKSITLSIKSDIYGNETTETFTTPKADSAFGYLFFDFEKGTALYKNNQGAIGVLSKLSGFTVQNDLPYGKSIIKISSGTEYVSSFAITPRWRCL